MSSIIPLPVCLLTIPYPILSPPSPRGCPQLPTPTLPYLPTRWDFKSFDVIKFMDDFVGFLLELFILSFFFFFELVSHVTKLNLNSLLVGITFSSKFSCLHLPSPGMADMWEHTRLRLPPLYNLLQILILIILWLEIVWVQIVSTTFRKVPKNFLNLLLILYFKKIVRWFFKIYFL